MFNNFNKEQLMMIGLSLVSGMIGALMMQFIFAKHHAVIATIDITNMTQSYIKETANQSLSMQEKQERINRFASLLTKYTEQLSTQKNVVLLPREAVISGGNDLTQQVSEMLKKGIS